MRGAIRMIADQQRKRQGRPRSAMRKRPLRRGCSRALPEPDRAMPLCALRIANQWARLLTAWPI